MVVPDDDRLVSARRDADTRVRVLATTDNDVRNGGAVVRQGTLGLRLDVGGRIQRKKSMQRPYVDVRIVRGGQNMVWRRRNACYRLDVASRRCDLTARANLEM